MKLKNLLSTVAALAALTLTAGAQMFTVPTAGLYNPRPALLSGYSLGTLMPGGTTVIPALSTNTFLAYSTVVSNTNGILYTNVVTATNSYSSPAGINVTANATNLWLFNSIGYTNDQCEFAFTGTATSTNSLYIYQSQDQGRTFTVSPIWQATGIAPGAAVFQTNFTVNVSGGGLLAFVVTGTGTTLSTNALLEASTTGEPIGTTKIIQ